MQPLMLVNTRVLVTDSVTKARRQQGGQGGEDHENLNSRTSSTQARMIATVLSRMNQLRAAKMLSM